VAWLLSSRPYGTRPSPVQFFPTWRLRNLAKIFQTTENRRGKRFAASLQHIPYWGSLFVHMAHVIQHKKKLLARVSRIRGQINGIERALEENHDCGELLLTLAACRGALNALMAEILEGHVRQHVLTEKSTNSQVAAGDELIEVIKRYLK